MTDASRAPTSETAPESRLCVCGHMHFNYPNLVGSCKESCGCVRYRPVPPTSETA